MKSFISKEKLSKKAQRELNKAQRKTWGVLNPITRQTENKNVYNRQKVQHERNDNFHGEPFALSYI